METLSEMDLDQGIPLGVASSVAVAEQPKAKYQRHIPPSKQPFNRTAYEQFKVQPLETKREILRKQWVDLSHVLLTKAEIFSTSLTKRDYGRMVQLLTSAGISFDKVFPKESHLGNNTAVFNLFHGLPTEKVLQVIGTVDTPSEQPIPTESTVLPLH